MPVDVVIGAGGKTGTETVKNLLQLGGNVRAVARNPERLEDVLPKDSKLELVKGDVTDADSLTSSLRGARGVVFAASGKGFWSADSVDHKGVANVAAAAEAAGVKRVVLVSSCLVTSKNRWHPIRIMLNNIRWGLMDAKLKGEEALRASGVPYTIVRPGGLTDGPAGKQRIIATQGDDGKVGRISRADVAAVAAAALDSPDAKNVVFEINSIPAAAEHVEAPAVLFKRLLADKP